jgi:hypothetical protein
MRDNSKDVELLNQKGRLRNIFIAVLESPDPNREYPMIEYTFEALQTNGLGATDAQIYTLKLIEHRSKGVADGPAIKWESLGISGPRRLFD